VPARGLGERGRKGSRTRKLQIWRVRKGKNPAEIGEEKLWGSGRVTIVISTRAWMLEKGRAPDAMTRKVYLLPQKETK